MPPKVCVVKLKKEMKNFLASPPPHISAIYVNERNMLEWHFLLEGPPDTPYTGGWYIGKLRFPPDYPWKPPSIMMLTPSGHFATGTRLCLSMSDFHPESWNPMWTVSSILTGLLSFMLEDQITTGSLETTAEEKQELAAKSVSYNLEHAQLKTMFQKKLQAAKEKASQAPDRLSDMRDLQAAVSSTRADQGDSTAAASGSDAAESGGLQSGASNAGAAHKTRPQSRVSAPHSPQGDSQTAASSHNDAAQESSTAAQSADGADQHQTAASSSNAATKRSSQARPADPGFNSDKADAMHAARQEAEAAAATPNVTPTHVQGVDKARRQAQLDLLAGLLRDADPDGALVQVNAALREHGDDKAFVPGLHLIKGQILARLGELQAAMDALEAALAGVQRHAPGQSAATILGLRNSFQKALDCKDKGNALFRAGQIDGAVEQYTYAIAAEPHYAVAHCNLAAAFAKVGLHQQAITAAQAALKINKKYEKANLRVRLSQEALES